MPLTPGCTKAPEMEMRLVRSAWTQGRATDINNYTLTGGVKRLIRLGGVREGCRARGCSTCRKSLNRVFQAFVQGRECRVGSGMGCGENVPAIWTGMGRAM